MFNVTFLLLTSLITINIVCVQCLRRPNIVVIVADDLGWNDVGLHGSNQIPTPNIDALGYNGIVLNKHYTMHICTPSRTALLTGSYPIRAGMQGYPLRAGEPRALPLRMATLAERLSALGYATHLVGKWHLGHQNRSVTPLGRGFQSHLGYWSGFIGYFDYTIKEPQSFEGFDLHENFQPAFNYSGTYATDLFTNRAVKLIRNQNRTQPFFLLVGHLAAHTGKNGEELEVPNITETTQKYHYIDNPLRQRYADIVSRLDKSVGQIVRALSEKNLLKNSLVLFLSDNGAPSVGHYQNSGSNWPLRGIKMTLYEGGVRNTAVMWAKALKKKQYVEDTLVHITDWMPTLYAAAGGNVQSLGSIDGINHWPLLTKNIQASKQRPDLLLNIDEVVHYEAILSGDGRYKLTKGSYQNDTYGQHYGETGRGPETPRYNPALVLASDVNQAIKALTRPSRQLTTSHIAAMRTRLDLAPIKASNLNGTLSCIDVCLFDLVLDPLETRDVARLYPDVMQRLLRSLNGFRKDVVPQTNTKVDPNANPAFCVNSWHPWLDPVEKCNVQFAHHIRQNQMPNTITNAAYKNTNFYLLAIFFTYNITGVYVLVSIVIMYSNV